MDTKTVGPPIGPMTEAVPTAEPRRSRRWPLVIVAILLVIGVGIFIAPRVRSIAGQPLREGGFGYALIDAPPGTEYLPEKWSMAVEGQVARVPVQEGTTFSYRFSLRNGGSAPVRIEAAGQESDEWLKRTTTFMRPDVYDDGGRSPWLAFAPFTLSPDQEAAIEVEVTVERCVGANSTVGIGGVEPVTVTTAGIRREVEVTSIQIFLYQDGACS